MFNFIKKVLLSERGTASVAKSASYQNYEVLGLPFDGTARKGRVIVISDSYTIGTATYTTGTADTGSGTVKLFTHKAGWKCILALVSTDGVMASGGVGGTVAIGDGTTADKYITATDFDAAATATLNATGHHYAPTADVTVTLTYGATGTPVAGQHIYYTFVFIAN